MSWRTFSGFALVALGLGVTAGWLAHYSPAVQVLPEFPPMVLATAICFVLAGLGLLAAGAPERPMRTGMTLFGSAISLIALVALAEQILHANLGLDAASLQEWAYDSPQSPGRMSRASAIAFLIAGVAMVIVPNARERRARIAVRILALALGGIGVFALMGHVVRAPLLFPDYIFAGIAIHTAIGFLVLATGLRSAWRRFDWGRERFFSRDDDRITFIGACILAATASVAALAGFAILEYHAQSLAADTVLSSLATRVEQFHDLIDMRERSARITANRPAVLRNLRAIRAGADRDGSNRANVNAVVESFVSQGFSAIAYLDAEGRSVARGGSFAGSPSLVARLATPDGAQLMWSDGFVLRHELPLRDGAGTLGEVVAEQRLPVLTRLINNVPGMGATGDMGLCVRAGDRLVCFPQRLNPRVFTTPLVNSMGAPLPMTRALEGQSGVEIARDYRGTNVVAAYSPLAGLGPGIVVKMDAAEVFAPVRKPLQIAMVFLLLFVAGGTLLVRLQVRPLATKLMEAEANTRTRGDEALREAQARARKTLEESEAALRRAQLMADLAHVITDVRGDFASWSETLPAFLGVEPGAMPRSTREWLGFVHPEDRDYFRERAIEAARRYSRMHFEYRLRRADGRTIHVRQWAEPLQGADDSRPKRWFSTMQDVTEQKHNEDEVRRLNQGLERRVAERTSELEMSNRELEAFSYSVSHDLRAPLRAIEGFSRLLENGHLESLDEEGKRLLARVRHNADYMSRLIDDLLTFSRMARQPVARKPTPMEPLVRQCLDEVRDEIVSRRIDVKVGKLPTVAADPALIAVVLNNLIGNALKYTRPREKASIEIGSGDLAGETAIYVRDNGVGFDMQYAGKLFGVFQRLHPSTQFEGTGVGLAIVQRIVQRHGGRVWAESKPDEGATFWFTLGETSSVRARN